MENCNWKNTTCEICKYQGQLVNPWSNLPGHGLSSTAMYSCGLYRPHGSKKLPPLPESMNGKGSRSGESRVSQLTRRLRPWRPHANLEKVQARPEAQKNSSSAPQTNKFWSSKTYSGHSGMRPIFLSGSAMCPALSGLATAPAIPILRSLLSFGI